MFVRRSNRLSFVVHALGLLVLGAALSACSSAPAAAPEYAVYAEHSLSNKPVVKGWNTRVFNKREAQEGRSISLDDKTGVVTLGPGIYHITASSLVAYFDPKHPALIPMVSMPPGGYARLRYLADASSPSDGEPPVAEIDASNAKALSIGMGSNADAIPSGMETFVRVQSEAKLVVEHQVGDQVKDLYLQNNGNGSSWHVFARIAIQRL